MCDIYGFYHVGLIGRWKSIFDSQLRTLKTSGLWDITKKIYIGTSGGNIDLPSSDKLTLAIVNDNLEDGEVETLRWMHEFSKTVPPCKLWYIHTKGASNVPGTSSEHHGENTNEIIRNVDAWRKYMEYFVIHKYKDCIAAIDQYDVCGVEYRPKAKPHFAGNFWWSRSEHVRNLQNFMESNQPGYHGRYRAETGFVTMGDPKIKCFFKANRDLYYEKIHPSEYMDLRMY